MDFLTKYLCSVIWQRFIGKKNNLRNCSHKSHCHSKCCHPQSIWSKYGVVIEAPPALFCCQRVLNRHLFYPTQTQKEYVRMIIIMRRMILFCLGQPGSAPPCPYKRQPPLRTDNTHPGHYLTSNPDTHTLHNAHLEHQSVDFEENSDFSLWQFVIFWCVVCAIIVLPHVSGIIQ